MNRTPAYQFYPDKWQSHTRRLSNDSYRVFHELTNWMWLQSPDYCSIAASPDAVACAVAMPIECVRNAMAEIQNPYSPLLKVEGDKWVCNGLRKEAEKQGHRRRQATDNANARWNHASASKTDASASIPQCFPSPTPSPTPSVEREQARSLEFASRPSLIEFIEYGKQIGLTAEWYLKDKFLAAEADNWRGKDKWQAYVARCRVWWESDGRPMNPPVRKNQKESDENLLMKHVKSIRV